MYMRKTEGISQLTTGLNLTALEKEVRSIDMKDERFQQPVVPLHIIQPLKIQMMLHVSLISLSHSDYDIFTKIGIGNGC